MVKLSFVTTCRADNYEGNPLERFRVSVEQNCQAAVEAGLDFDYTVVEWVPPSDNLFSHHYTKDLFQKYPIRSIVVERSLVEADGLNPDKYAEYFAKNVGIKRATGENILVTNCDIVFDKYILGEIKDLIDNSLDPAAFYRTQWRTQLDPNTLKTMYTEPLANDHPDGALLAGYSGDFLLAKKEVLLDLAKGYDETNEGHRKGTQTSCDGEILFQLQRMGCKMLKIENRYGHIYHSKTTQYDSSCYNQNGYNNRESWGYRDAKEVWIVPDKVLLLTTNN